MPNPEYLNLLHSAVWGPARLRFDPFSGSIIPVVPRSWENAGFLLAGSFRRYDPDNFRLSSWEPVNLVFTGSLGLSEPTSYQSRSRPEVWKPSPLVLGGALGRYSQSNYLNYLLESFQVSAPEPAPLVLQASLGRFSSSNYGFDPFKIRSWEQPQVLLGGSDAHSISPEEYCQRFASQRTSWENVGLMFGGSAQTNSPPGLEPIYWAPVNNPTGYSPGRFARETGSIVPDAPWFKHQIFPKLETPSYFSAFIGEGYTPPRLDIVDVTCGMPLNVQGTMVYNAMGGLIGELGPGSTLQPWIPPYVPGGG